MCISKCEICKFSLEQDFGHSNYTIEGTTVYCLKGVHPSGKKGFDNFYGKAQEHDFANNCPERVEGDGICIDCDKIYRGSGTKRKTIFEAYKSGDPEVDALFKKWCKGEK